MRKDILERKEEIMIMINNHETKSKICKVLHCKPLTLDDYLKKMGITYKGNKGRKGKKRSKIRISALEYSQRDCVVTPRLRIKLIEDGIKKEQCEICETSKWMGQKLVLELHHKDGNRFNNNFDNLQILCPNCHSLIPNHKNKKRRLCGEIGSTRNT